MTINDRLRAAGHNLQHEPVSPPAPASRTRSAASRSRRALAFACVAIVIAGVIAASTGHHHSTRSIGGDVRPASIDTLRSPVQHVVLAPGSSDERDVAAAEQGFTLRMLDQLINQSSDPNVVFSPSSIATALAMLEPGAVGETRTEIANALGTSKLSADQQAAGWGALADDLNTFAAQNDIELHTVNRVWLDAGFTARQKYLDTLAKDLDAGVQRVAFGSDPEGARSAINDAVEQATKGKITDLMPAGSIDSSTVAVLTNASYLKAPWPEPFGAALTKPGTFHSPGRDQTVSFMHNPEVEAATSAVTDRYEAVELPYAGGRLAALFVEPKSSNLATFARDQGSSGGLTSIARALRLGAVDLSLPKIDVNQAVELTSTLRALGIKKAFGDADLSNLGPGALAVSSVHHQAFLRMDERGTEAAAATGIGIALSAIGPGPKVVFDRPYLVFIRDTDTGAVLYAAAIQDPSTGN